MLRKRGIDRGHTDAGAVETGVTSVKWPERALDNPDRMRLAGSETAVRNAGTRRFQDADMAQTGGLTCGYEVPTKKLGEFLHSACVP